MIKLKEAVIVEGKYDKLKLCNFIDGLILITDGFGIFKDKKKLELIRRLAVTCGVIILTDSDAAGFRIRSYLNGCLREGKVYQAYIPDVPGKERRKEAPSAEGKLGVEGMSADRILEALERAGVVPLAVDGRWSDLFPAASKSKAENRAVAQAVKKITRQDLYEDGLSGGPDSKARRQRLAALLHLPERLSTGALADVLSATVSYEDYKALITQLDKEG